MNIAFGEPDLTFLTPSLGVFAVVLMRVLGLVLTAPQWSLAGVNAQTRIVLAIGISTAIAPGVAASSSEFSLPIATDVTGWINLALLELSLGAAMGLSAALVVTGARQAGELVAQHAGLAPASLFDIEPTRTLGPIDLEEGAAAPLTPLGHFHALIALSVFLSIDGPMLMVRGLIQSFVYSPPGLGLHSSSASDHNHTAAFTHDLIKRVTATLAQSLQAAAPAGVALLLAGLTLAWVSRSSAGRPMSGLDWPVRVALGLVVSTLSIATLATTLAAFWTAWGASIGGF